MRQHGWRRLKLVLVAVLMVVGILACQGNPSGSDQPVAPPAQGQAPVILNGTGASFPMLFYTRLFSEYNQKHPNVMVNYQDTGSAAGIQQMIAATVDFAGSDVAMTDAEIAQVAKGVVMVPMTAGSVAIAYNLPSLGGDLKLSRAALAGIFLGEITQWNDPAIAATNPDRALPDLPIILVHRSDGSGTTAVVTHYLSALSPQWEAAVGSGLNVNWPAGVGIKSNAGVSAQIQQAEGTLGYVEYSYAKKLDLATAALENQAGNFVQPSSESAQAALSGAEIPADLRIFLPDPAAAEAYPIVTYSWLLLYESYDDPSKAAALKDVVQWGLTEAQNFSEELGYVPLPQDVVSQASEALTRVR
ncbi:MAG TPA: phosphate ABC transporter substrate-binding protein PstS [Leptolyngbyaceae cyanobacterium M65_K2018_010]|nr:phosphate ABC transporter substrate-binding protein PstS [Leptolyngbyaceae cyanobacterium M65_K2018_010]